MLKAQIRTNLDNAVRQQDSISKNILRVVLGEIETQQKSGPDLSDDKIVNIISQVIKSNLETIRCLGENQDRVATLARENEILQSYLPVLATQDKILEILTKNKNGLTGLSSGARMGAAMKIFKGLSISVSGNDVKTVLETLE